MAKSAKNFSWQKGVYVCLCVLIFFLYVQNPVYASFMDDVTDDGGADDHEPSNMVSAMK